jgi:proteasome accessory factor B
MSKQTFLSRYALIIAVLERGPATFEQINDYLKRASELEGVDYTLSLRTFQRDIKDIYYQIGYEIANEKKGDKRYLIKDRPETMEYKQRLLESYQMINVIKVSSNYSDHIFFENRKAKGLEHFPGLLSAINNK